MNMRKVIRCAFLLCVISASGCISTVVGTVADVAIEVVKVPFKAGAAVVDAVSSDEEEDADKKKDDEKE